MGNGRETYGIGEWYGRLLTSMTPEERRYYADATQVQCPFGRGACSKRGGVCSLRRYVETKNGARPAQGWEQRVCATCPGRFGQDDLIYRWIGRVLLDSPSPIVLGEVDFLEDASGNKVGKIDGILVHPDLDPLRWCALEKQAVYFSGTEMPPELRHLAQSETTEVPFPVGRRHPDFRSSGPKRLMPQLQIKVPTLRRWGKKMAVVVDDSFFGAMGAMDRVEHISNGDIIWFVVGYEETAGAMRLVEHDLFVTTLESSVVGLTAGEPVSQEEFEATIRERVNGGAA